MIIYTIIILIAIIIDQVTKYIVITKLKPIQSVEVLNNVFGFTYAENKGAAFSILNGMQTFLVLFTAFAMAGMFVYLYRLTKIPSSLIVKIAIAMLIGGGIGNLIDRVRYGYVVDFIELKFVNFAIFNVADIFVCIAVTLICISTFLETK